MLGWREVEAIGSGKGMATLEIAAKKSVSRTLAAGELKNSAHLLILIEWFVLIDRSTGYCVQFLFCSYTPFSMQASRCKYSWCLGSENCKNRGFELESGSVHVRAGNAKYLPGRNNVRWPTGLIVRLRNSRRPCSLLPLCRWYTAVVAYLRMILETLGLPWLCSVVAAYLGVVLIVLMIPGPPSLLVGIRCSARSNT